jgi:hypothetical protein
LNLEDAGRAGFPEIHIRGSQLAAVVLEFGFDLAPLLVDAEVVVSSPLDDAVLPLDPLTPLVFRVLDGFLGLGQQFTNLTSVVEGLADG